MHTEDFLGGVVRCVPNVKGMLLSLHTFLPLFFPKKKKKREIVLLLLCTDLCILFALR